MSGESVCLLLRASWYKPLVVENREEMEYYRYEDDDEVLEEALWMHPQDSASTTIVGGG